MKSLNISTLSKLSYCLIVITIGYALIRIYQYRTRSDYKATTERILTEEYLGHIKQIKLPDEPEPDKNLIDIFSSNNTSYILVWAPWCDKCEVHLQFLQKLQQMHRGSGVGFATLAIRTDSDTAANYLSKSEIRVPAFVGLNEDVIKDLNLTSVPSVIILNKKGKVAQDIISTTEIEAYIARSDIFDY